MVPLLLPRPHVTRGLNDTQRFSLSPILCRTHVYKQSFYPRIISLWNSLPNQCFPKNYNMDLLFLLDGVIFGVIAVSFISEHLIQPIVLFYKNQMLPVNLQRQQNNKTICQFADHYLFSNLLKYYRGSIITSVYIIFFNISYSKIIIISNFLRDFYFFLSKV